METKQLKVSDKFIDCTKKCTYIIVIDNIEYTLKNDNPITIYYSIKINSFYEFRIEGGFIWLVV